MEMHLKPIREQVIVITGAYSGIGLATARAAARRGARVVLNSRDATALGPSWPSCARRAPRPCTRGDVAEPRRNARLADVAVRRSAASTRG